MGKHIRPWCPVTGVECFGLDGRSNPCNGECKQAALRTSAPTETQRRMRNIMRRAQAMGDELNERLRQKGRQERQREIVAMLRAEAERLHAWAEAEAYARGGRSPLHSESAAFEAGRLLLAMVKRIEGGE